MPGLARRPPMSLHRVRQASDPGYEIPILPGRAAGICTIDHSQYPEAKRFPAIIIAHRRPPCRGDYDADLVGGVRRGFRESRRVVVPSPVHCEESMQDIAKELQRVVKHAAGNIAPGMGIKAQINASCENLGYPRGFWRVREAWYGEASNWRGRAIFDLLGRYNRWCERNGAGPIPANDPYSGFQKATEM